MRKRKPNPKIALPRGHVVRRRSTDAEIEHRRHLVAFEKVDRLIRPIPSLPVLAWPTRPELLIDE